MANHKLLLLMLTTVIGDDRIRTVKGPTRDTATHMPNLHKCCPCMCYNCCFLWLKAMNREESSYAGESQRMAHKEVQTGSLPSLSQAPLPAWVQVVEAAPNQGALNMTAQLQEITTRRHRLYFIRRTVRLHAQHYHLRIAGLLPARNKML